MTQEQIKEYILAGLAGLVLLAFVWLFVRDLWTAFSGKKPGLAAQPPSELEDPRLYVATAVAALVGSVSAIFLGVEAATLRLAGGGDWGLSDSIRVAYVIVYILFSAAAIVAWVNKRGDTPVSLRNLAVTFIGIAIPAVAAYLGVKAGLI